MKVLNHVGIQKQKSAIYHIKGLMFRLSSLSCYILVLCHVIYCHIWNQEKKNL